MVLRSDESDELTRIATVGREGGCCDSAGDSGCVCGSGGLVPGGFTDVWGGEVETMVGACQMTRRVMQRSQAQHFMGHYYNDLDNAN